MNTGLVLSRGNADLPQGARGPEAGPTAAAWRRELGRAVARGWFHGPLDARSGSDIGPGALHMRGRQEVFTASCAAGSGAEGFRVHGQPLQPPGNRPVMTFFSFAEAGVVQATTPGAFMSGVAPAYVAPLHAHDMCVAEGEVPRAAPAIAPRAASADHHEPVRIHVEHGEQGSTVWIGLDGDAGVVDSQAQAIVAELARQVQGARCRLAAVICNGLVVYGEASGFGSTTRRETPWR